MAYETVNGDIIETIPGYTRSDGGDASRLFDFYTRVKVAASEASIVEEAAEEDPTPAKKKAATEAKASLKAAEDALAAARAGVGGFSISPAMLLIGAGVAYFLLKNKRGGAKKRRKR